MITRFLLPMAVLGLFLGGCCQHGKPSTTHPAYTTPRNNRYELASREADPLANYGAGTSAGIPHDPTVGSYPGKIELPVTPLMTVGD